MVTIIHSLFTSEIAHLGKYKGVGSISCIIKDPVMFAPAIIINNIKSITVILLTLNDL